MPQGSLYDAEGNLVWTYDICCEFDCNEDFAEKQHNVKCGGDFTKKPCLFHGEHIEMNLEGDEVKSGI